MKRSSIRFLHRVRIHGGEFDASARAMHRDGMTSSFQAAVETVSIATIERKQMSTKTTFKRVALVTVAALGFGLLSTVPSSAATQSDQLTLSAATASQLTGETKTAGSAVATVSFLSGGTDESLSVTAYLTSAPAGNTALPVLAVSDTSSAQVQSTNGTNLAAGAAITSQVAFIVPTAATAAASAKLIVYMNAPTKTGTYVVSLVPAVGAGGGVKNSSTQTLTITVGTNPTLDTVITSATSILNVGETISATSDATVTGSKSTQIGAADSATAAAAATIVVTAKNANGTTVPGTGNAGESITATITGSGTLGAAAWGGGTAENGALPSGRAITVKLGHNIAVFADGSSGVGTITITSALGVVLATEKVTFYGAIASMTATVEKAAIGKTTATADVIKVIAKDSAGTVVSSGNVYATTLITSAVAVVLPIAAFSTVAVIDAIAP